MLIRNLNLRNNFNKEIDHKLHGNRRQETFVRVTKKKTLVLNLIKKKCWLLFPYKFIVTKLIYYSFPMIIKLKENN